MSVKVQSATDPTLTLSKDRCEPGSVNIPLCRWPKTAETTVDPDAVASKIVDAFNSSLAKADTKGVADLFLDDGYWRDHLGASWELRTLKGRDKIATYLSNDGSALTGIEIDKSAPNRVPQLGAFDGTGDVKGIQFFFNFTSKYGAGQGLARLSEKDGSWKIFTFFTTLREIKGHEEATYHRRPKGVEHGGKPDRKNWLERRIAAVNLEDREPTVLILGMGGLPSFC